MAAMPELWIRILQVKVLMENKKEMRKAPMKKNRCPAFKMLDKIYSGGYTTTILTKYGAGKVMLTACYEWGNQRFVPLL